MRKPVIIVAPHPDDEIIGCFEILKKNKNNNEVLFVEKVDLNRISSARVLKDYFGSMVSSDSFNGNYEEFRKYIDCHEGSWRFYFPDPYFETHPAHRVIGSIGVEFLKKGVDVIFYSTNMQTPYIHEVKNPKGKLWYLNRIYSSEKSLWENDHKYFLFEGYCKWLF
jgi:hypothetical protein